jgi:hypothetical protein
MASAIIAVCTAPFNAIFWLTNAPIFCYDRFVAVRSSFLDGSHDLQAGLLVSGAGTSGSASAAAPLTFSVAAVLRTPTEP